MKCPDQGIYNIVTNNEVAKEAEKDILAIGERGQSELQNSVISIWSQIKQLNLKVFSAPLRKSKYKTQLDILKENNNRDIDVKTFSVIMS